MLQKSHAAACFFLVTLSVLGPCPCRSEVSFSTLHGSDLGMGVGAKAIGMGGAFVATADDPSAVFWNPAGLTGLKGTRAYVSLETPEDFSAAVLTFAPDVSFLERVKACFGLGYINRLRFKGDSGSGTWSGPASHILDLSMVDLGDSYSGKVDSTTRDVRFSAAFSPGVSGNLSMGITYMLIQ